MSLRAFARRLQKGTDMKHFAPKEFASQLRKTCSADMLYLCGALEICSEGDVYCDNTHPTEDFVASFVEYGGSDERNVFVNTSREELLGKIEVSDGKTYFRVPERLTKTAEYIKTTFCAEESVDAFDFLGTATQNAQIYAYLKKDLPEITLPADVNVTEHADLSELSAEDWDILPMLDGSGAEFLYIFEKGLLAGWLAYGAKDINALGVIHVFTHPHFRGRGFATLLARKFAQKSLIYGCVPFYGSAVNDISAKTALAAGFEPVGEPFVYLEIKK